MLNLVYMGDDTMALDEFDLEAMREGKAIKRAFRGKRTSMNSGIRDKDHVRELKDRDNVLVELNVIDGKPTCHAGLSTISQKRPLRNLIQRK